MAKLHGISEACKDEHRKADVVFIHGLGGDAFGTWRHGKDEKTSWPHWLAEAFPDVGVWSLGHAADPSKPLGFLKRLLGKGGRDAGQGMSLPDRAGQILDLMRLDKHFRGECPIVFVCHSLGGLLAKQILRKAHDKASITDAESISRRTAGVLFLATPHNGADLATLADKFAAICGPTASLEALRAHDPHLRDLYNWYRNHAKTYSIETATYYEGRDTTALRLRIVDETSSQPGVGPEAVMLDEDHLSIAKPRERDAQVCLALEDMLRTVQDHAIARKLVQESQHKQRQPDLAQDAASIRQQLDEQGRQIELLTAAVANLREQAQGPDADAPRKRAYELLQRGETMPAIALLGEEADVAASAAESQRDAAVSLYRQQAALQTLSDLRQAMQILEKALQLAPDDIAVLRETGDLAMTLGHTGHAATLYQRLHAAVERKLEADPGSPTLQRDLSISHNKLGAVQQAQGDLPGAQQHYATALAIRERLAVQDPANTQWQRDLSISHERLGAVQQDQGDLLGAERHYAAALAIAERLAAQDPANVQWQHDLSVSHEKLGDVQQDQGDLPGAQQQYATALAIRERFATQDPANTQWQRDLSVGHNKLGSVQQARSDHPSAQQHYATALAIAERLAAQDPANAEWQRDLSVSHNMLGAVQQTQGDLFGAERHYATALDIVDRLAAQDPANAVWQRDLSISHERLGAVQQDQGDLLGAERHYVAALAIRERLAEQDPANAVWQRDLSISHEKLGTVQKKAQGDLPGAQQHYATALAISERLAAQDPANAAWQYDLAISRINLASVRAAESDLPGALAHLQIARSILQALQQRAPDHPQYQNVLGWVERHIAALEGGAAP